MRKTIKKLLNQNTVFLDIKSTTKQGVIEELIDNLCACGKIKDKEAALDCVLERESKMSTGMKHGIAIPHGKTNTVDELVAVIARKNKGVDFDSLDKKPSRIFIMTLSPLSHSGPHIQFLAEVSKLLKDAQIREKLMSSKTKQDIIKLFT